MSAQIKSLQSKPFGPFHTAKKLFIALWFPTICVFTRQKSGTALALLVFTFTFSLSHAQSWQWARSAGGFAQGNEDEFTATAVDDSGNVYVAGKFKDLGWFDSLQLNAEGTNFDAFVAKYSCQGQLRWVRRIEGPGYAEIEEMILDKGQNPVIVGGYGANIPGDSIIVDDTTFFQSQHPFMMQILNTGNRGWIHFPYDTRDASNRWNIGFPKLICQPNNSLVLYSSAGGFYSKTDSLEPGLAIIKYTQNGSLKDVHNLSNGGRSIAIIQYGNKYLTLGEISGSANGDTIDFLGAKIVQPLPFTGTGFVAMLNQDFSLDWVKSTHGGPGTFKDICADGNHIYIGASFGKKGGFDAQTLYVENGHTRNAGSQLFVLKLDDKGNLLSHQKALSQYQGGIGTIGIDSKNTLHISGVFVGETHFDTIRTFNVSLLDQFYAQLNSTDLKWKKVHEIHTTGDVNNAFFDMAIDAKDNVILAGKYEGWLYFDPQGPNKDTLFYKGGNSNAVVLKFGSTDCPVPPPVNSPDYGSISLLGDGFELFPNPSSARVELQIKTEEEIQALRVYTISGQVVYNQKIVGKPESLTLAIAEYKTGVYLVELLGKNNHWVRRLVKVDD